MRPLPQQISSLAVAALLILVGSLACSSGGDSEGNTGQAAGSGLSYEQVQTDGNSHVIVVSPDYMNEADATALGQKLLNDFKGESNSFVFIFTDKVAAQSRDAVLANKASDDVVARFDRAFVGTYFKNASTGFHQSTICFGGFVANVDCHTVKY